jgi:hypothetical protein
VALAALSAACAAALFTAPPGSTIRLQANPPFVASHGGPAGTARIVAIVTEPAGTFVSDGTVVYFFTTLGTIDAEAKTRKGAAQANFVSDSRSGTATITALSGGPAPTPTASASPGTGGGGTSSGDGSATLDLTVGNVNITSASQIRLGANPPRITISNSTHVTATVVDTRGNPLANVLVYFRVVPDSACVGCEFFDGAGRGIPTNNNGEAEDVMRTRRDTVGQAQVVADVAGAGGFLTSAPFVIDIR